MVIKLAAYYTVLIAISCFAATAESQTVQNLDRDVQNRVKIKTLENSDGAVVEVTIRTNGGGKESMILPRVKGSSSRRLDVTNALYTALSCSICYATTSFIYDFVKWSPLLYRHKLLDYFTDESYREEFQPNFEKHFKQFAFNVAEKTSRFVQVLSNFLNAESESSYYRDASLLETLLRLQMKTFVMRSDRGADRPMGTTKSRHRDVVRSVLNDAVDIQRSQSTDCRAPVADDGGSRFRDLRYVQTGREKRSKVDGFIDACAKDLSLEIDPRRSCSPSQTFFGDFVAHPPADDFSRDVAGTAVVVYTSSDTGHVPGACTIEDLYNRMKTSSYDAELIYWYQHSVVVATVKIVFREILNGLRADESYVAKIAKQIEHVHNVVSADRADFPELFVGGFAILYKFKAGDPRTGRDAVWNFYMKSLIDVELMSENDGPRKRAEGTAATTYVENVLNRVVQYVSGLRCFQKSFKPLRDAYNSGYYVPFKRHKNARVVDDGEVENPERFGRVCDFAANVYAECYLAIMFLHDIDDPFHEAGVDGNDKFDNRLYKILKTIQHYFLLIIKKHSDDVDVLKMAYDVAPILINTLRKSEDEIRAEIKPVLQKVMTEMNGVGIRYCSASTENDFLLINRMNFYELGNRELIAEAMERFYQFGVDGFNKTDLNESSIDPTEFDYLNVSYLYANFVKDSVVINDYGNTIRFYWYGQVTSIRDIYQDADLSLTKSDDLYALYDIYFKFYIVTVFYEIKETLSSNCFEKIKNNFRKILRSCKLQDVNFPRGLKLFITDVNELLAYPIEKPKSERKMVKAQLKELESKIDKQLVKFNVVIFKKNEIYQFFVKNSCFSSNDTFKSIENELSGNVKKFYENFKKITRDSMKL